MASKELFSAKGVGATYTLTRESIGLRVSRYEGTTPMRMVCAMPTGKA